MTWTKYNSTTDVYHIFKYGQLIFSAFKTDKSYKIGYKVCNSTDDYTYIYELNDSYVYSTTEGMDDYLKPVFMSYSEHYDKAKKLYIAYGRQFTEQEFIKHKIKQYRVTLLYPFFTDFPLSEANKLYTKQYKSFSDIASDYVMHTAIDAFNDLVATMIRNYRIWQEK